MDSELIRAATACESAAELRRMAGRGWLCMTPLAGASPIVLAGIVGGTVGGFVGIGESPEWYSATENLLLDISFGAVVAMLVTTVLLALTSVLWTTYTLRRLTLAVDEEEVWRPRRGMPHPEGRDDTHDRFTIRRALEEDSLVIGLHRWSYDGGRWRFDDIPEQRRFGADDLDEAAAYEDSLRENIDRSAAAFAVRAGVEREEQRAATGRHRLLAAWMDERERHFPSPIGETRADALGAGRG